MIGAEDDEENEKESFTGFQGEDSDGGGTWRQDITATFIAELPSTNSHDQIILT